MGRQIGQFDSGEFYRTDIGLGKSKDRGVSTDRYEASSGANLWPGLAIGVKDMTRLSTQLGDFERLHAVVGRAVAAVAMSAVLSIAVVPTAQAQSGQLFSSGLFNTSAPSAPAKSGGIGGTGTGNTERQLTPLDISGESYNFGTQKYPLQRGLAEQHTAFSFRLSPGRFEFSRAGHFGLTGVFANPEFELRSGSFDKYAIEDTLPVLHDGLSYSAGVNFEHENAHISDTAYVSSGQLGVSYGRMGRVWYSGVDLSIEQSAVANDVTIKNEKVSFDLTTGRRMGWTGLGAGNPLWLLSLRGDFDLQDEETERFGGSSPEGDWFLNPSLFWDTPDFRFAAQLEVPLGQDALNDDFDPPSYKLRAVIEKSFR